MKEVRLLLPEDADAYVAIRREMLTDSPWAFGSSPGADDRGSNAERVRASLADRAEYAIAGAFDGSALLAVAGMRRETSPKQRHIAIIWGVYATPPARGRALGLAVVRALIDHARTWAGVESLRLSVSDNAPAARRTYDALGFIPWGHEPDCIRVNGRSYAEIHMHRSV